MDSLWRTTVYELRNSYEVNCEISFFTHLPDKSLQNVKLTIELSICRAKTHFRTVKLWFRNRTVFSSYQLIEQNNTFQYDRYVVRTGRRKKKERFTPRVEKNDDWSCENYNNERPSFPSVYIMNIHAWTVTEKVRKAGTRGFFFYYFFRHFFLLIDACTCTTTVPKVSIEKRKKQTNDKSFSIVIGPEDETTAANDRRSFFSWVLFFNLNGRRHRRPLYGHRTIPLANDYIFHLSFYSQWQYTSLFFFMLVCREILTTG